MNSDPYDSAAWRSFGMLDAEESAAFDDATRHDPVLRAACLEMDRLAAAVAAATTAPMEPKEGQLARLQTRLHLTESRRAYFWLGVSGWAAAAAMGAFLVGEKSRSVQESAAITLPAPAGASVPAGATIPAAPSDVPDAVLIEHEKEAAVAVGPLTEAAKDPERKVTAKVETKRLVQEIEVLRESLQKFQHRDRALFEPVPGMAVPVVMRMNPPGVLTDDPQNPARNEEFAPIATMLGDALRGITSTAAGTLNAAEPPDADPLSPHPAAIPIYDAARDVGTLVVNNLPPAGPGKAYNLWVTTATGDRPIYVGSLPENSASGADSFDFSLGSTMVLPSGFILTVDRHDAPATPTKSNTVLQGPPVPPGR